MAPHQGIAVRHSRVSQRVVRVLLYCFSKIRNCFFEVFPGPLAPVVSPSQVEYIGSNVVRSLLFDEFSVFSEELNLQGFGYSFRDVSLYLENVLQLSVVFLCPDGCFASDIDQLYADPESGSSLPYASLKNSSDLEFSSDLAHALVCLLVFHHGCSCNHVQSRNRGECVNYLLGKAVREILVLVIGAKNRQG